MNESVEFKLYFTSGPSDKVYHVVIEKKFYTGEIGYSLITRWGRRGGALSQKVENVWCPVLSTVCAEALRIAKGKICKGYTPNPSGWRTRPDIETGIRRDLEEAERYFEQWEVTRMMGSPSQRANPPLATTPLPEPKKPACVRRVRAKGRKFL